MKKYIVSLSLLAAMVMTPVAADAQQRLTLEECRQMAIQNDESLQQAQTKIEMSGYDRKIALANYFPNVSATGAYVYNHDGIALVSDATSQKLQNIGTVAQGQLQAFNQGLMQAITSNPQAAAEYMQSPMWQTMLGAMSKADVSQTLNALGQELDNALHPDLQNVFAAGVSVTQPIFMGGKIINANKIARLAEELSKSQYEQKYQETIVTVDQAYWQIVSIAAKKKLAVSYSDLLQKMVKDTEISMQQGVLTQSDVLSVKVKANEAEMLRTKADNGLVLAKMLLCKETGLPLDSEIVLADEELEAVPVPQIGSDKSIEDIWADRPETKSLDIAARIYDGKVRIARADMLPKVAATAGYMYTNPNTRMASRRSSVAS
jgi:Outer membrane protein